MVMRVADLGKRNTAVTIAMCQAPARHRLETRSIYISAMQKQCRRRDMHRSFGIETHPKPNMSWSTVKAGPSLTEVKEHIRKIVNYRQIFN